MENTTKNRIEFAAWIAGATAIVWLMIWGGHWNLSSNYGLKMSLPAFTLWAWFVLFGAMVSYGFVLFIWYVRKVARE